MNYVLVQAGEGHTETILEGHSKEDLITKLEQEFQEEIDLCCTQVNKKIYQSELDALRMMLNNHADWEPGRYVLENIEPIWQEWTLYIQEDK